MGEEFWGSSTDDITHPYSNRCLTAARHTVNYCYSNHTTIAKRGHIMTHEHLQLDSERKAVMDEVEVITRK